MQFPQQEIITRENKFYAYQTDTIENWVTDDVYPSMCVTITSTHSDLFQRHVAVLISIMFYRNEQMYMIHFVALFEGLGFGWNGKCTQFSMPHCKEDECESVHYCHGINIG